MRARRAPSYCHACLPQSGLGNKLFVWAKALVFARLNDLPLVVTGWTRPQLAPLLRGGDLRLYLNHFRRVREIGTISRIVARFGARIVEDPALEVTEPPSAPTVFRFRRMSHWSDYFGDLKAHRAFIRAQLLEMLTPARRREFERTLRPIVCVHVRTADFRPLREGEEFRTLGNVRTPIDYFVELIEGIRAARGARLPVTVVSDGSPNALRALLSLPEVRTGPKQTPIAAMLMMAGSRILVPSAGSTFSYWSAFLGDNAVLMHPDHLHQPLRPDSVNKVWYEGPATGDPQRWPRLLLENIRAIQDQ